MLMMALAIISLIHSAVTMRDAVSRAQILWAFGGLVLGIGLFMLNFPAAFGWVDDAWTYQLSVVASLGIPVIGLGLAMAVLRYRLFDIDIIIRRTTSYAILTGLLLLVYFGTVVILQRLLSPITGESRVAVVLSTLLIAALFLPLAPPRASDHRPALLPPKVRCRKGAERLRRHRARRDGPGCADGRTGARHPGDDAAGVCQRMAEARGTDWGWL